MLRMMGTLFLCMGKHIHAEGCGSYFANKRNEKTILLSWRVETMILLLSDTNADGYADWAVVI